MNPTAASSNVEILYEPHESPPLSLTIGLGFQLVILNIGGIVLTPAIVIRAGGGSAEYLAWAVFAAVIISGASTILQALGKYRIGAGYVLIMGTSGAFIGICISAMLDGGPALMSTLVIISSLVQITFARKLSKFRRILTPAVTGTVIMLIAVTVMPILFDMMAQVPENATISGVATSAGVTLLVTVLLAIKARGFLRLWSPMIGVVIGAIVSAFFGLYNIEMVQESQWFGFPSGGWPGLDLTFGPTFWAFLPAFIFVTIIGAIETVGDSIAIQKVSWRTPRAPDFRTVQGALSADGIGNFLSGVGGTIPNTTYSTAVSVVELTGVASRACGVAIGIILLVMSVNPKFLSIILAIPDPVVGAFLTVLIAMLFVLGMKIVVQDGINYRNGLICGISFWIGVGLQNGVIFPEFFDDFAAGTFENGMVSGGLVAILLTILSEFTLRRRKRFHTQLNISALDELQSSTEKFSKQHSWSRDFTLRVEGALEEALLILCKQTEENKGDGVLELIISDEPSFATLEFFAGDTKENLEDRIALMGSDISTPDVERNFSIRMLKHLTASVRHERYHGTEILTLKVHKSTTTERI
ncbi:MAG: purine/pyrimidine permease [Bacteroidetes bacterium]|nr:purine/pyrimidine permease [Bacteroidota bacterium]